MADGMILALTDILVEVLIYLLLLLGITFIFTQIENLLICKLYIQIVYNNCFIF